MQQLEAQLSEVEEAHAEGEVADAAAALEEVARPADDASERRPLLEVFAGVVATVLAGVYCLSRIGFEPHAGAAIRTVSVAYFAFCFPFLLVRLARGRVPWSETLGRVPAAVLMLAALVALIIAGWAGLEGALGARLLVYVSGAISFAYCLVTWFASGKHKVNLRFVGFAGLPQVVARRSPQAGPTALAASVEVFDVETGLGEEVVQRDVALLPELR